jgi:hypothetical protein
MLTATFAAWAATRIQESAGEYVDDSAITTRVKSLVAADDILKKKLMYKKRRRYEKI